MVVINTISRSEIMFTVQSAYRIGRATHSMWSNQPSVSSMTVANALRLYRELYLTLESPVLDDHVFVNLNSWRTTHQAEEDTIEDFFAGLSDLNGFTVDAIPSFRKRSAQFSDLFLAGYSVELNVPGSAPNSSQVRSAKSEVSITRADTNIQMLFENSMFTVNGFFFRPDTDGRYVYLPDAGLSIFKRSLNNMGIITFEGMGGLEYHEITDASIFKDHPDVLLSERTVLRAPEEAAGKTLILVLGGYLIYPQAGVFYESGDGDWTVDMAALKLPDRYFESNATLDFSSLELSQHPNSKDIIDLEEFNSDDVTRRLLRHKNSFFVTIDNPRVNFERNTLVHQFIPGCYATYAQPNSPLFVGAGRLAEYHPTYEEGQWGLAINAEIQQASMFHKKPVDQVVILNQNKVTYKRGRDSNACFLDISCDVAA